MAYAAAKPVDQKVPDYIAKHKELYGHISEVLRHVDVAHKRAQLAGEEAIGHAGPEAMRRRENRVKFAKAANDVYVKFAEEHFHRDGPEKDPDKEEMLMLVYNGLPQRTMLQYLEEHTQEVVQDPDYFNNQIRPHLMAQLKARFKTAAAAHLNGSHIHGILNYVGLEGKIDGSKVQIEDVRGLLESHHEGGSVTKPAINKYIPDYAVLDKTLRSDYEVPVAADRKVESTMPLSVREAKEKDDTDSGDII